MSHKPSDFEEWLDLHQIDKCVAEIREAIKRVDIEVKAGVPKDREHVKKYQQVVDEDDYEYLFKGLLEPRKESEPLLRPAANDGNRDDKPDNRYEPKSFDELAEDLLQKAEKLGWEEVAQKVADEHIYPLLIQFTEVVNKELAARGTSKRGLVKTVKRKESLEVKDNNSHKAALRLNWARPLEKHDFGYLYDRLVAEGFMEDTGKECFLYYFAGEGEEPTTQLVWTADPIVLAVLVGVLARNKKRKPWTLMSRAFVDIKPKSLSATYSRAKNNEENYGGQSYEYHAKTVQRLLQ